MIAQKRKEEQEKLRAQKLITRKKNSINFLMRMKQYSKLPQFKDATFNIPKELALLDQFVLNTEQMDQFIWMNNLISVKKQAEEEIAVNSDESTQSESSHDEIENKLA